MHKRILLAVSLLFSVAATAQNLPIDTAVRIGHLPNGMTYYIRHNELPKNSVDFHIAQRVGSILEEESQRGLAHFLEHMAFNGTKHFPESESFRSYLESVGVKFGANLNAYTSIDETVYMITNVPTTRTGIIDTCLLILHDWSNCLLLTDDEIDKERGVIHEEWRTRQSPTMRMYEKMLPEVYGADRYAERLPIGLMSVVDNFKYQELRDYYRKWYRPDLQGIVIVGDVDVDDIENRIKNIFADIPAPVNPARREYFPVSDNKEPIFSVATDPEATMNYLLMFSKHEAFPPSMKNTPDYLVLSYIQTMAIQMFNARLDEIAQKKSSPFVFAASDDCDFLVSKTKQAWEIQAGCKEGQADSALAVITREMQRVLRHGFTETEYARTKADLLKSLENAYNEREKERNDHYTQQYIDHFLDSEPIPGIAFEYNFFKTIADLIGVTEINGYMNKMIGDENVVVMLMANAESKIPSKEELKKVYEQAKNETVAPYVDSAPNVDLIEKSPKKGKQKSVSHGQFDSQEMVLKNGMRVILKQTDFKQDEVLLSAFSTGGTSLLDDRQMPTILLLNSLIDLGGLGNFSSLDLQKALAGKNVSLSPNISLHAESFSGNCSPSDFESLLQLLYLYFTQPRADNDVFDAYISSVETMLAKAEQNPDFALKDSIYRTVYGSHPRARLLKKEDVPAVDYALALKMYRERFMNNDAFTFVFVGNLPDSAAVLIEKYIGALPKVKHAENFADTAFEPRKGEWQRTFEHDMEIRKTTVYSVLSGSCEYTLANSLKMSILNHLLDILYTKTIREEEGGTYGVRVRGSITKWPTAAFELRIFFDTDPEKSERMKEIMYTELERVAREGFSDEDFAKTKEYMQKHFNEQQTENAYWLSALKEYYLLNTDKVTDFMSTLNAITKEDVRLFLADILSQGNKAEVVMNPTIHDN